jgi:hypothetical protein
MVRAPAIARDDKPNTLAVGFRERFKDEPISDIWIDAAEAYARSVISEG